MREFKRVPVEWLKAREQARKQFLECELRPLGESMKVRQLQPVAADLQGNLLWGERRVRAAKLVGLKELDCLVTDEPITESELRVIQITENVHRSDLLPWEKWMACQELMQLNPQWQQKDLAKHLKLDEGTVSKTLSPSRCIAAVQEAFKAGALGLTDCWAISRAPSEQEQRQMLADKLGGATRDELTHRVRQKRSGSAVRVSRVRCQLGSGICVAVSGPSVGLDEVIDALGEAIKQAKKALTEKLDVKTWQAVMSDKAKAR